YGICEQCDAEIDPARLKALPYATLCLRCQQRLSA
ncbi:MAG: TraR/DksA family transcriptional regulator, partial [Anaerolineae bacterium]|nr:TraR/DksA family transcriptional regulator [Anaerolineae bacterium]